VKVPCYGCSERSAECHAVCEAYRIYAEENARAREERRKLYPVHDMLRDFRTKYLHRRHQEKRW
jgi:hypothetical protein